MRDAYCGNCKSRVTTKLLPYGKDGLCKVCSRCETAHLFRAKGEWIAHVHERVMRQVTCDHKFEAGDHHLSKAGQCDYCGLPEAHETVLYSQARA